MNRHLATWLLLVGWVCVFTPTDIHGKRAQGSLVRKEFATPMDCEAYLRNMAKFDPQKTTEAALRLESKAPPAATMSPSGCQSE
jgi:hypothetical protein